MPRCRPRRCCRPLRSRHHPRRCQDPHHRLRCPHLHCHHRIRCPHLHHRYQHHHSRCLHLHCRHHCLHLHCRHHHPPRCRLARAHWSTRRRAVRVGVTIDLRDPGRSSAPVVSAWQSR